MAQFCVYENPNPVTQARYPYLLDIQSDFLSELKTTVVIPLAPAGIAAPTRLTGLNPVLEFDNATFTATTQDMAGISRNQLGKKACDLSGCRSEVIAAIDFLMSGI